MLNLTKSWLHCNFHGRTGDCRASALQELCAPRYLKLLLYNHPSLHTLEVPSVFHERFGDEVAERLADALNHNDHLLPTIPPFPRSLHGYGRPTDPSLFNHSVIFHSIIFALRI